MLRSITEFVFAPLEPGRPFHAPEVREADRRVGRKHVDAFGEVRVLVGAEQLVAADAEGVVPAVALLGAERLRLDDELHRAEAVQLVHQERPVGNRHPQAGEHAPERPGSPASSVSFVLAGTEPALACRTTGASGSGTS